MGNDFKDSLKVPGYKQPNVKPGNGGSNSGAPDKGQREREKGQQKNR